MNYGSNYENPFSDCGNEKEIFSAKLATDCLIERVLEILPIENRRDCDNEEDEALVHQYVTDKMGASFVPRLRHMMFDHIADWQFAQGAHPDKPKRNSYFDRIADLFQPSRASTRARTERWHQADQLLTQALSIRSHRDCRNAS